MACSQIRTNTAIYYRQSKYQLYREESEGYAKLLTVLNNGGEGALSDDTAAAVLSTVLALIGFFDLDPNRVLDLVIDAFEREPAGGPGANAYLRLLGAFHGQHAAQARKSNVRYMCSMCVFDRAFVRDARCRCWGSSSSRATWARRRSRG